MDQADAKQQQRCTGRRESCERCQQASKPCLYSSVGNRKGAKRLKRHNGVEPSQDDTTSTTGTPTSPTASRLENEVPRRIRKHSEQKISSPETFMEPTSSREETIEDSNRLEISATSLEDDFAFPHDFLPGFLPMNDLQGLGGYPDLDLDGYFLNEMPSIDFAPSSRDLGTIRSSYIFVLR